MLRERYSVQLLCNILNCSRSGYYDWIKLGRPKYKAYDKAINNMVMKMYKKDDRWGIESIRMQIKKVYGVCLTNKTVYRYMRINGVQSIIRKKTKRYSKVPHHNIPNLLQRNFNTNRPNRKWSIDISYLFCKDGLSYICAIKDMCDKSIVSWSISRFIDHKLVMDTLDQAIESVPYELRQELILHSDQGWHFTHDVYKSTLKRNEITQSISAKGSSVDNAPIESFFSALKTECIYLQSKLYTYNVEAIVKEYIFYYNNERLQKKIKELAPLQFRKQVLCTLFI
ncbi:MAG: IS3 family transposase [Tenericutes bacterium]|nr:IS3 family transposase [Mycoplasmatota bacterium]